MARVVSPVKAPARDGLAVSLLRSALATAIATNRSSPM